MIGGDQVIQQWYMQSLLDLVTVMVLLETKVWCIFRHLDIEVYVHNYCTGCMSLSIN